MDTSKNKIKIEKEIFWKQKGEPFKWKDIKNLQLEDDDILNFSYEEPYYSENNSHDGYHLGVIIRMVEETDEQFKNRMDQIEKGRERLREMRYENYLKLKEEFEGEDK